MENKKIIVSMTSWTKRIKNVGPVVYSILKNSIIPDLIICNLSETEFPNKEKDLPEDLLLLSKTSNFEINWVKENTKVFKKFIPTLQRFYKQDYYLFTIDDDELYDSTYIETGVKALKNNKAVVIAKRRNNESGVWGGMFCCHSSIFDKSYWENITDELIKESMNDPYTNKYFEFKNIKVFNVLEKHNTKFNDIFPNRNGTAYSKEKIERVKKLVDDIFLSNQFM